jgi:GTP-binding nuclear protein Ran
MSTPTFKIVLVGNGGVGKTAWVEKLMSGCFVQTYTPTLGVEVHPITFNTTRGVIRFNVWDTAGQERFSLLKDGYYVGSDAAIVVYDTTSKISYTNVPIWKKLFNNVIPDAPVIICGNKSDIPSHCEHHDTTKISVKTGHNMEEPFLLLARKLMNDNELTFVQQ